jgi:hypothetical protein
MAATLQHRIFLAPAKPAVSWSEAQAHWRTNHETIMLELPGLLGDVVCDPGERGDRLRKRLVPRADRR